MEERTGISEHFTVADALADLLVEASIIELSDDENERLCDLSCALIESAPDTMFIIVGNVIEALDDMAFDRISSGADADTLGVLADVGAAISRIADTYRNALTGA